MEDHFLRVRDGYSQKMDSTWAVAPPHPALRGMVQPYIGYVTSTKAPEFHLGLPSPYVTFVLTLDTPLTLLGNEDVRDVRAGVGGLQLEPVVIDQRVLQRGVHVCVDPLAVHSLFGLPAAELFGTTVDLDLLPPTWTGELVERAACATTWSEVFGLLDRALLAEATLCPPVPEVGRAWQLLRASAGRITVQELAHRVGWSRRHLSERFRSAFGLTTKQAVRLVRFDRSVTALRHGARDLASTAAFCGYADQPHLTREWQALAGSTPVEWIHHELPFLQSFEATPWKTPRHEPRT